MSARPGSRRLLAVCLASGVTLTGLTVAAAAATTGPAAVAPVGAPFAAASASSSASASPTATSSASATPAPAPTFDSDGLFTQPRKGCLQFADPAGDASLSGVDNDDDLDLTGVVYKTTSSALQVFVKEAALGTAPSSSGSVVYDGHRFSTTFVIAGRKVVLSATSDKDVTATVTGGPTASASPTATPTATATATPTATASATASATPSPTTSPSSGGGLPIGLPGGGASATPTDTPSATASATPSGSASPTNGGLVPTATFDTKNSNIVFSVPRAQLAQLVGAAIYGAPINGLAAQSAGTSSLGFPDMVADDAAPTKDSEKTYVIGDNTCFLPPPAKLFLSAPSAAYTDTAVVTGSIQDSDGVDLSGQQLVLHISGLPDRTLTSNASGDAVFRFKETLRAGTRPMTLTFAGTTAAGRASVTEVFSTRIESTQVKLAATRGVITGTLLDNDNHPIVNRHITFAVGTRRYNVTTDAHGKALLKGIAKGTTVKAFFTAVPTLYASSRTAAIGAL
ncbi:MAG: hypothetical protein JWO12_2016 [Frankiales bacterium]|nr:hypothetical protein [Frankiales bacterium]